jgi:HlyD family secretion protein
VIAAPSVRLRLVAWVSEADVGRVLPGPARFTTPAFPGRTFPATIVRVDPAGEAAVGPGPYRVILDVENATGELRAGLTATVELPAPASPSRGRPSEAPVQVARATFTDR